MWHSLSINQVFNKLSSTYYGLSEKEVKKRLNVYGENKIEIKKENIVLAVLKEQLSSPLVLLLVFSSILSFLINEIYEAALIILVVIIYILFDIVQRYRSDKVFELLKKESTFDVVVKRDGKLKKVKSIYLVPGDIVILKQGNKVPADIRIIKARNALVDESIITGESKPVIKEEAILPRDTPIYNRKNMLYSGTYIIKGHIEGIVVATGNNTYIGKLAKKLESIEEKKTLLDEEIEKFSKTITAITLMIILFVFILVSIKHFFNLYDAILFAIALGVAVIPEGLPTILVIIYTISLKRIFKKGAIVKKLASVETLGSVDVIFTDKTGTLTYNQQTVRKFWFSNEIYVVTGSGYSPEGEILLNGRPVNNKEKLKIIAEIGINCSESDIIYENGKWNIIGDPLEAALIVLSKKIGYSDKYKILDTLEFDQVRKIMSVLIEKDKTKILYVKGAPERIIEKSKWILINNKIESIDKYRESLLKILHSWAKEGYRLIAYAFKKAEDIDKLEVTDENNLIFVSILALEDPIRERVKEAIKFAKEAHIDIIVITGDHIETAKYVARKLGLSDKAINAQELKNKSLDEIYNILKENKIVARADPEDKFRIVKAFKERGHIVAMTGDGVNDTAALKLADIGISLNDAADIAKEVADMILINNSFDSIIEAIKEGRRVFYDLKSILSLILTINFGLVTTIVGTFVILAKTIFRAIHILFINVAIEDVNSITAGTNDVSEEILRENPPKRIVTRFFIKDIIINGIILGIYGLFVYLLTHSNYLVILFFVLSQYALFFHYKNIYKIRFIKNPWFYVSVLISIDLTLLLLAPGIREHISIDLFTFNELGKTLVMVLLYYITIVSSNKILSSIKRNKNL